MKHQVTLYDVTLREGAQGAGAAFTLEDKMKIVRLLDDLGIPYVEAGNPFSNPKDAAFFRRAAELRLKQTRLVAFGATGRVGMMPEQDLSLTALAEAGTPTVCIFGKCWDFHVQEILGATLDENLETIRSSVRFLKDAGREVIFDAEHYFDGMKQNKEYTLAALHAAADAGADWIVLCDTNGGSFPHEVEALTAAAIHEVPGCRIGIHCHNDTGMADANAVAGVLAGASMVHATVNGLGERCGNTDLCTLIPNLQLKLGYPCVPPGSVARITMVSHLMSEWINQTPDPRAPYVGRNAFAHKAGMHIHAVMKNPASFEHIAPEEVGAERRMLLSEVSGRTAVWQKVQRIDPTITKEGPILQALVERLKELEYQGYQFEAAEASFELEVRRMLGICPTFFELRAFKVIVAEPGIGGQETSSAMIDVSVNGEVEITAAVGNGPVNALDRAVRKALERFYPSLGAMHLTDYKVRVLDSDHATASVVRVLVESTDGTDRWTTIGVSPDILNASWKALVDSLEYKLLRDSQSREGE